LATGNYNIFVLVKQVPDQGSKAGLNPDGTIDRAKAKRMLNPFDRYALQAALFTKRTYGGRVTAISMGPPPATEVLLEALEHGVDAGCLLCDKRLAASDTLATAYALYKTILYVGKPDVIFVACKQLMVIQHKLVHSWRKGLISLKLLTVRILLLSTIKSKRNGLLKVVYRKL